MDIETLAGPEDNDRDGRLSAAKRIAIWSNLWSNDDNVESMSGRDGNGRYAGFDVRVKFPNGNVYFTVNRFGATWKDTYDMHGVRIGAETLGVGAWCLPLN